MKIRQLIRSLISKAGYTLEKKGDRFEPAMEQEFRNIVGQYKDCLHQPVERLYALYKAVNYIEDHRIPGDIVECGVYKGGSLVLAAQTLKNRNQNGRKIYLYDTFEGMSRATEKDVDAASGKTAEAINQELHRDWKNWCYAPLEEVQKNVWSTEYPKEKFVFVKGKVEETLPAAAPEKISILRLDTDWYESTYHELRHLFPKLVPGGVLILDDYGHWKGAKEAVDQYFSENPVPIFLHRVDYAARIGIKI